MTIHGLYNPRFFKLFRAIVIVLLSVVISIIPFFARVHAAQAPPEIVSYQGRLTDSGGNLLGGTGTTYYFKFSIWNSPTVSSGSQLWPTTAHAVSATVKQGVFTVNIGDTANGYPDALNLDFSKYNNLYLQVQVSSNNTTFETLSPRQRLTSALFAQVSGAVVGTTTPSIFGTTTPISNSFVTISATSSTSVPLSISGVLNQTANLFQIFNNVNTNLFSINAEGGVAMVNATSTNFFATTASSTNLFTSNLSVGSLSGFLKATAGSVTTALVNLSSDVTGILPITNGGIGTSTAPSYGQLLIGNASGAYDLVATSTLGINSSNGTVTSIGVAGGSTGLTTSGGPINTSGTITLAGVLNVAHGGTGASSYSGNQILYSNAGGSALITTSTSTLNIGGNAGTVTNGLYSTGTYANPAWLTAVPYSILSGTVPTWNQNTTGNAGTATTLATARTIAGVSFDGSANISLNNNAITNGAGYTTNTGTVTSVGLSAPTGLAVSGSPVTGSGTLALALATGYNIPLTASTTNWNSTYNTVTANSTNWNTAYTNRITSATAPLAIASNALSISQSNTSTNGYLSSTDWNTFNNKVSSQWTTSNNNIYNNNTGNVGIGTTNPTVKLDVAGALPWVRSTDTGTGIYASYTASGSNNGYPRAAFDIGSNLGDSIANVGFWVYPSVSAGIQKPAFIEVMTSPDTSSLSTKRLILYQSTTFAQIKTSSQSGNGTGTDLKIFTQGVTNPQLYLQASTGYLGVGTSAPGVQLDVLGTYVSGTGIARFKGNAQNGFVSLDTTTGGATDQSGFLLKTGGVPIGQLGVRASDNAFYIRNRIYGTSDIVTIASNGNVGIGTTTPRNLLSVMGNIQTESTGDTAQLLFSSDGANKWGLQQINSDSSGRLRFYDYSNNAERLTLTNSGNVGIGTTSPYAKLSVVGEVVGTNFTAISTTATSTFPYLSVSTNSNLGTVIGGVWNGTAIGDSYITKTGNWTGSLNGQVGSYYLNASNLTNFGSPFYTYFNATTTDALSEGSTNLYFTNARADARINATSTIGTLTSLANLATVGALGSGSITSNFGTINTGASNITTTGTISGGNIKGDMYYDAIVAADGSGKYTTVHAATAGEAAGASIFIKNGTYVEGANIVMKSGQKLVGESREGVILDMTGGYALNAWGSSGSHLTGILLDSFSIGGTNNHVKQIWFYYVDKSTIRNVRSYGAPGINPWTIYIESSEYNLLDSVIAEYGHSNFFLKYSNYNKIINSSSFNAEFENYNVQYSANNAFVSDLAKGGGVGIYMRFTSDDNTFTNMTFDGMSNVFAFYNSPNRTIITGVVAVNTTGQAIGEWLGTSADLSLSNSYLEGNAVISGDGFHISNTTVIGTLTIDSTANKTTIANSAFTSITDNGTNTKIINTSGTGVTNNIGDIGNIGIGTTTPQSLLSVVGNIQTESTGDTAQLLFSNDGANKWGLQQINSDSSGRLRFYDYSNNAERLTLTNSGNVGIGTTSPALKLQIADDVTTGAGLLEYGQLMLSGATNPNDRMVLGYDSTNNLGFINAGESGVAWHNLILQGNGGNVGIGSTAPVSKLTVVGSGCFSVGAGATLTCGTTPGNIYYTSANTGNYDIAEKYRTYDISLSAGDVITLDPKHTVSVTMATSSDATFIGVISSAPGVLLGGASATDKNEKYVPVALSGRVPVKVSLAGGAIAIGDKLTVSSTTPGVAVKMTGYGAYFGQALQGYSDTTTTASSTIIAFINPGIVPMISLAGTLSASSTPESQSFASSFFNSIFSHIAVWFANSKNGITDFFVNRVHTKELCLSDSSGETCITRAKLDALLANVSSTNTSTSTATTTVTNSFINTAIGSSTPVTNLVSTTTATTTTALPPTTTATSTANTTLQMATSSPIIVTATTTNATTTNTSVTNTPQPTATTTTITTEATTTITTKPATVIVPITATTTSTTTKL